MEKFLNRPLIRVSIIEVHYRLCVNLSSYNFDGNQKAETETSFIMGIEKEAELEAKIT